MEPMDGQSVAWIERSRIQEVRAGNPGFHPGYNKAYIQQNQPDTLLAAEEV
jgi:hypothetical protein